MSHLFSQFRVFYDAGFRVTINTDDRLMSDTSMTKEFEIAVRAFDLWLNVLLIVFMFSLFLIKRYTKWKGRNVTTSFKLGIMKLRKYHRPAGMVLLLSGLVHGYLAMGNRFDINHNGFLLWVIVLVNSLVGMFAENSSNVRLGRGHIHYAVLILVAVVYHLLYPGKLMW